MQCRLDSSSVSSAHQWMPVTSVVQDALASPLRDTDCGSRRVHLHPATVASTVVVQNAMLRQRAVELVEKPCKQHGILIQTLGEYPLFSELKLVRGEVTDVVVVPADQDPLVTTGTFPLPKAVRDKFRKMEKAGVPLDRLYTYIAHEVPSNSVNPHGPLPLQVIKPAPSRSVARTSKRLGTIAHAATISLLKRVLFTVSVPVVSAGAAGVVATELLLDPVIFGALADEHGMATWFVLAQWVW